MLLTFNKEAAFVHPCVTNLPHGFATFTAEMLIATCNRTRDKWRHDPQIFRPGDQRLSVVFSHVGQSVTPRMWSAGPMTDFYNTQRQWLKLTVTGRPFFNAYCNFFTLLVAAPWTLPLISECCHRSINKKKKRKCISVLMYWLRSRT